MVREICRDESFLGKKAELATAEDLPAAQDLLETLIAHKDGCVGMHGGEYDRHFQAHHRH